MSRSALCSAMRGIRTPDLRFTNTKRAVPTDHCRSRSAPDYLRKSLAPGHALSSVTASSRGVRWQSGGNQRPFASTLRWSATASISLSTARWCGSIPQLWEPQRPGPADRGYLCQDVPAYPARAVFCGSDGRCPLYSRRLVTLCPCWFGDKLVTWPRVGGRRTHAASSRHSGPSFFGLLAVGAAGFSEFIP